MSTQVQKVPGGWRVSTVSGFGKRRRIPRGTVKVHGEELEKMKEEVRKQAAELRVQLGLASVKEVPVV